jgi:thiamine monophosphate synthase
MITHPGAAAIREIERAVKLPITVDAEGGYGHDPAAVAETVARLIDAGAVGINLEDGSETVDATRAKIEAIKGAAARAGVDLFVNTRTDVFLRQLRGRPVHPGGDRSHSDQSHRRGDRPAAERHGVARAFDPAIQRWVKVKRLGMRAYLTNGQ